MPANRLLRKMLDDWEHRATHVSEKVATEVELDREDLVRVRALAEVYRMPAGDLLADLIATALRAVEEQIPYVPGDRVIRVEEGDPVYEDVGRTPAYLAARARLENET